MHATARRLLISTDDGEWAVPGALTAWHAWESVRPRFPALADSPWVLPALRRGPGLDSRIGGRLSNQALQATFTKHAVRTAQHLRATVTPSRREQVEELALAYRDLSYDSYRRLALAAGAPPVSPAGSRCEPPGRPSVVPPGGLTARQSSASCSGTSGRRRAAGRGGVPFGRTPGRPPWAGCRGEADLLVAGTPVVIGSDAPRAEPPDCRSRPCFLNSGATRCCSQMRYSAGT